MIFELNKDILPQECVDFKACNDIISISVDSLESSIWFKVRKSSQ